MACLKLFFWNLYLAVNRQPWFLRERARREGFPCPPDRSCAISEACSSHKATRTTRLNPDYTAKPKKWRSMKNHLKMCLWKIAFPFRILIGPKLFENDFSGTWDVSRRVGSNKMCGQLLSKQKPIREHPSYDRFRLPTVYLCSANFECKTVHGAKTITLRGTFSMTNFHIHFKVLHALNNDIKLTWKKAPGKIKFVKSIQKICSQWTKYCNPRWTVNHGSRGKGFVEKLLLSAGGALCCFGRLVGPRDNNENRFSHDCVAKPRKHWR